MATTTTTTRGVEGFEGRREEVQNVTPPARRWQRWTEATEATGEERRRTGRGERCDARRKAGGGRIYIRLNSALVSPPTSRNSSSGTQP